MKFHVENLCFKVPKISGVILLCSPISAVGFYNINQLVFLYRLGKKSNWLLNPQFKFRVKTLNPNFTADLTDHICNYPKENKKSDKKVYVVKKYEAPIKVMYFAKKNDVFQFFFGGFFFQNLNRFQNGISIQRT